jgi:galactan endo-1,6-beta-galactosidase
MLLISAICLRFLSFLCLAFSILGLLSPLRAEEPPVFNRVVQIDPTIKHGTWKGWGTSLCWDGNVFGNRDDLADLLFTTKIVPFEGQKLPGLGMNIVRYNAGACSWNEVNGKSMGVSKIIFPFRHIQGFWLDGKNSDPHSSSWNWKADKKQRSMLKKAHDRGANYFELFSNSPMWWMCKNLNPSGSADGKGDNLAPEFKEAFATYLATIAKQSKDDWGISFTSVEPFNEPSSDYWKANGKQEGCHFSRSLQAEMVPLLRKRLDALGLKDLPIAASDETSYNSALSTWESFSPAVKALVNEVNVHGYQYTGGKRAVLYQLVSNDGKALKNSEYGDKDESGLLLAHCLDLDFCCLHPSAWCYWQPFDYSGWGFLRTNMARSKFLGINPKYFVVAQFTRHIREGMTMLKSDDTATVAAFDSKNHHLVLVIRADRGGKKLINLDKFTSVGGPVTRWITEPKAASRYEIHQDVKLVGKRLELLLPPDSVETLEIENVTL